MKKSIFFISLTSAIFLNGCAQKSAIEVDENTSHDYLKVTSDTIDSKLLDGVWWLDPNDIHALFYIIGDSLYYTEDQQSPYLIKLKNDTLIMSKTGTTFKYKLVRLSKDSLWMYDQVLDEMTRLYKKPSSP
jgi:hypothetical protein